jgi:phosphopantetheine--protein transferase-like protein
MQDVVKNVVAQFLKIEPSQITANSVVDKTTVGGSIMVHRLYASLADQGFNVADYLSVKTFGELVQRLGSGGTATTEYSISSERKATSEENAIGIDIELIDNLPVVADFRTDTFYQNNFSPYEISHCLMAENPRTSFAGLFAAKEALVKMDNTLSERLFNCIEITHTTEGKPMYGSFRISISHAGSYAVAVAVFQKKSSVMESTEDPKENAKLLNAALEKEIQAVKRIARVNTLVGIFLALAIAALAVFVVLEKNA